MLDRSNLFVVPLDDNRRNESMALGFVMSLMVEAAVTMIGVVSLLAVVTMRQDFAGYTGADAASLTAAAHALVDVRDWTFLFGPGLMPALDAVLLGTLLYLCSTARDGRLASS